MLQKEELQLKNLEINKEGQQPEIKILNIPTFDAFFNLFKSDNYKFKNFSNDLQDFCKESEKYNYLCEKNIENKIPTGEKSLFEKFISSKNRFDFQIIMSEILIHFFQFLKNFEPLNKKEYNIIKNIFQIFTEIKESNLLMDDIQCLVEYGLFKDYNNNFYLFLFDMNEKNISQLFIFFDINKYLLSNVNNINIFIFKFNELINKFKEGVRPLIFVKKIEVIISELFSVLNSGYIYKNSENLENKHKLETFKEKIINEINKEKIFDLFFSDEKFTTHLDILLNLFKIFTNEIDKQINILLSKNNKDIKKVISKFIIKHASFIDDYIERETLYTLNDISIENTFTFYINQYTERKNRLINIYNMFRDNKKIISMLVYILKNKLKKEKQAELIEQNLYNEEKEFELEEKEKIENNKNIYFLLPDNYKIYYISAENNSKIKESLDILDNLINSHLHVDEYLGIDTEWKSSPTFLDNYVDNLSDTNKNKDIIDKDKSDLSDIIQIAGNNYGFIFDTKSIYKNNKIRKKIENLFSSTKFIGFGFYNDVKKIGEFFKKIVYKNSFIELSNVYKNIKKKNAPELKAITLEMFNKELDKRDQISNWSNRPLLSCQIKYGILDAYVLLLIYEKLNEKNK